MGIALADRLYASVAEVDATRAALRISNRPLQSIGQAGYSAIFAPSLSTAAGTIVASIVNTGANLVMVRQAGLGLIGAASSSLDFMMQIARSYTALETGGALVPASVSYNGRIRTSMQAPTSLAVRAATTVALTAGSRTVDSNGIRFMATGSRLSSPILHKSNNFYTCDYAYPLTLAQGEGLLFISPSGLSSGSNVSWSVDLAEVLTY